MPINYIYSGYPTDGTDNDDFIFPMIEFVGIDDSSVEGRGGGDLVIGDSGYIFTPGQDQQNNAIATAFSLDDVRAWSTGENPMFGDTSIAHATAICETTIGQIEVYSVTAVAGQPITVDIDFGDSAIGVAEDFRIEVVDIDGAVIGSNDNSPGSNGGLGSSGAMSSDPYVTLVAPASTTYYIRVTRSDGSPFTNNATFVLNVSAGGHAVSATTTGRDTLLGGDGDDVLLGQGSNDTLVGGNGSDTLHGGSGDDIMEGGVGADVLIGGLGIDTVSYANSSSAVEVLLWNGWANGGEATGDTLSSIEVVVGSGLGDTLAGRDLESDTLRGGAGDDTLTGLSGDDTLQGNDGTDVLHGGAGIDTLTGGAGNDFFIWDGASDSPASGTTWDYVTDFVSQEDVLQFSGEVGRVFIYYQGSTSYVSFARPVGGSFEGMVRVRGRVQGFDVVTDGVGVQIDGGAMFDTIFGGAKSDLLSGFDGFDNLWGGDGDDFLYGGNDGDTLLGEAGADFLSGEAGPDLLEGGLGNDDLRGGDDVDTAIYQFSSYEGANGVIFNGSSLINGSGSLSDGWGGTDTLNSIEVLSVNGSVFDDQLTGSGGTDSLFGYDGDDIVNGGGGRDTLGGNDGDDRLFGGDGIDDLGGDDGDDTLAGGAGADALNGGAGLDTADYSASDVAVSINLIFGWGSGGHAQGDTLTAIERVIGSALADNLIGSNVQADILEGGGGADVMNGRGGDDTLIGGAGADDLDGGDDVDTASYADSSVGVLIDLVAGTGSGGDAQGDRLHNIENVTGSAFGDTLFGNGGANRLSGGGGDDLIIGGAGADVIDGGDGLDRVSYAQSSVGVLVSLNGSSALGGDAEGDSIVGVEHLIGSAFNDTLIGDNGDNFLSGGLGADNLNGEGGSDAAVYADSNVGVRVRLFAGTAEFGHAAGDVLTGIENLTGSAFNDQLAGDEGDNIIAGGAGADILDGRGGFDTLSYATSSAAVVVNLSNRTASGGDAAGDTISNFESVIGSNFNDLLNGGNGDQTIEGGLGNDRMNGGNGVDTLSYRHATGAVTVSLALTTAQATGMGNDTLSNFEHLMGSRFADSLTGNGGDNTLNGGAGADALNGGLGIDTADYSDSGAAVMVGLAGVSSGGDANGDTLTGIENLTGSAFNDTLTGDGGANRLRGGAGADTLDGGGGIDWVDYTGSTGGVTVELLVHLGIGGDAEGDWYANVENVSGSSHDDILRGDHDANVLLGGAGADQLDGRGGSDWVSYEGSRSVTVNLTTGVGSRGDAAGDTFSEVENVIGSSYSDQIYGARNANHLMGGDGNDTLHGRGGDDILEGGVGTDRLNGGSGADAFVFGLADIGTKTIQDFSTTSGDVIRLDPGLFTDFADAMSATTDVGGSAVISRGGISITLTGVTKAQLSAGDFEFFASAPAELLVKSDPVPLTLPPITDNAPLVLPQDYEGKVGAGVDPLDPLILPVGHEPKIDAETGPEICLSGEGAVSGQGSLEGLRQSLLEDHRSERGLGHSSGWAYLT